MDKTNQPNEFTVDERDLFMSMQKLDLIRELRDKQNQFEQIRENLQRNIEIIVREDQVLRDFRKELDLLVQERLSHIEELRIIHADINIMETTIKQGEEERNRNIEETETILNDYQPVKEQINRLREILNLEKIENDQDEQTTLHLINQQTKENDLISHRKFSLSSNKVSTNPDRTNFRQQPAPMKTCQSCQQQIHRNAPICPICKAKSRSRNPKKAKRREIDVVEN